LSSDTIVVIGGGPAGLEAAASAAELGSNVVLIEQRDFLGGMPIAENYAALTPHFESAEVAMGRLIDRAIGNDLVEARLSSEVSAVEGSAGDFQLTVTGPDGDETVECGSVIIAAGFQHFDPGAETQMYGYYEHPDVIALQDLEGMLKEHNVVRPSNGQPPEKVCFVQCVGSRDRQIGNEYCSKVCCGVASKEAIEIRQLLPDCQVFIFYIDMRMYGYWENQIYWPAQEEHRVQYIKGIITEVLAKGDKLLVRVGLPGKALEAYLAGLPPMPDPRLVDVASGLIYTASRPIDSSEARDGMESLRQPAIEAGGYAVAMAVPPQFRGNLERWGYQPEAIDVMRRLKDRWDPAGILNPGVFL